MDAEQVRWAVASVAAELANRHPELPPDRVHGAVYQAATELVGNATTVAALQVLVRRRAGGRLAAWCGEPVVIRSAGRATPAATGGPVLA